MGDLIRVLIADDEPLMRVPLTDSLRRAGYEVRAAATGDEAIALIAAEPFDVAVIDLRMPGADGLAVLREIKRLEREIDAVVITAYGTIQTAVEAMKLGARDFLTKPFETAELLRLIDRYGRARAAARDESRIAAIEREGRCAGMIGVSRPMARVFSVIASVADTDATILVRGAFTGADRMKKGRFEAAEGGTIFLDEIEEMPLGAQVKLLRAIQEREIQRLGGVETIGIDVRLVAATKRDLRGCIAAGTFREDLFYRLNVLPISLPPLRERHGDIPVLAAHFLAEAAAQMHRLARGFSPEAEALLAGHDFPGNVRELKNLVERAVALCPGNTIQPAHIGEELNTAEAPAQVEAGAPTLADAVRVTEQRRIDEALEKAGGNRTRAAEILGISRKTLWEKLKKREP